MATWNSRGQKRMSDAGQVRSDLMRLAGKQLCFQKCFVLFCPKRLISGLNIRIRCPVRDNRNFGRNIMSGRSCCMLIKLCFLNWIHPLRR